MATGVQTWSTVPVTNATADSNINWAEGMAPSQVNDSARALMASVAKWRDDHNGTIVTSGTTLAYTAITSQVEGSLVNGYEVTLQFHATNDVNATLAVDGLAASPLQLYAGKNVVGQDFPLGSIQCFTYSTSGTGQWIWHSYTRPILSAISNSLSADVTLTTTSFFDGPTVAQGTTGVWFASGTVTLGGNATTAQWNVKLWDGTTVIASAEHTAPSGFPSPVALSGVITNPTTNIKISASSNVATSVIKANQSGIGNTDSTLTAIRVG